MILPRAAMVGGVAPRSLARVGPVRVAVRMWNAISSARVDARALVEIVGVDALIPRVRPRAKEERS